MRLINLECPSCHANLQVDSSRDSFYCTYCGARVLLDYEGTRYVYVDEAGVKEAEVKERIRLKELEIEEQKLKARSRRKRLLGIVGCVYAAIIVFLMVWSSVSDNPGLKSTCMLIFTYSIMALLMFFLFRIK